VAGTWLHQWARTSGASQRWQLEQCRNGRVRIRSVLAGKCIDLVAMNTKNGARAQIWTDVMGGNQEWNIRRVENKDLPPPPEPKAKKAGAKKADLADKINSRTAKLKKK